MKEYETLTREKVDVVPSGCGMPETHLMQDWSDRMLDLILNGPTINGIKKNEVRAMLRETYTALKQYEKIGPMASPFINDPTAIVARAFSELYPGVEYVAQYVPDLRDETNGTAYGLTIFPDDGSTPIVCISAEAPISAAPELLAHELAHVATPEDTEHGESWSAAIGNVIEEMADVQIMLDQLRIIFHRSTEEIEEAKLERLKNRLDGRNNWRDSSLHKWIENQFSAGGDGHE